MNEERENTDHTFENLSGSVGVCHAGTMKRMRSTVPLTEVRGKVLIFDLKFEQLPGLCEKK